MGNAYQLEEQGYDALRNYLDGAAAKLVANPDREEILSDIEQAIADKLRAQLGPYKNVAATSQVVAVVAEMGPVEAGAEMPPGAPPPEAKPGASGSPPRTEAPGAAKRLYRLYDGAMISGVCNGIAAYLNLDPTIVRLAFVIVDNIYRRGRDTGLSGDDLGHPGGQHRCGKKRRVRDVFVYGAGIYPSRPCRLLREGMRSFPDRGGPA